MGGPIAQALNRIDFSKLDHLVVAVSGGSDSVALLFALRDKIASAGTATRLTAVTVDHGLRAEASAEADWVAGLCAKLDIDHRISRWRPAVRPRTGIAAAARMARYRLLAEEAERCGAEIVVTGHTLDDQIETAAMRQTRGSGRGLSGMAPLTAYENRVWIMRPLLSVRRNDLRRLLQMRDQSWIEDPSNFDGRSERVRVRRQIAADLVLENVLLTAIKSARGERVATQRDAAKSVGLHYRNIARGLFETDIPIAAAMDDPATSLAFRAVLANIGGREHLADQAKVVNALSALSGGRRRISLSGCVVERSGTNVLMWREFRGSGPTPVSADPGVIWDRRWLLRSRNLAGNLQVAARGLQDLLPDERGARGVSERVLRAASAAEPILRTKDGVAADGEALFERVLSPWRQFLPSFDLDLAVAVNRLIGGAALVAVPQGLKPMQEI